MKGSRAYRVRNSSIHGRGVFATRNIRKNSRIVEYAGKRITEEQASVQPARDSADPHHTFLYRLSDGSIIDGGTRGNAARWINHSCAPNCEGIEYDDGTLFIHAIRTIRAGEELVYDYRLSFEDKVDAAQRQQYPCKCGAADCRGTMLLLRRRRSK